MNKHILLLGLSIFCHGIIVTAQEIDPCAEAIVQQPTVMIVPVCKEGQNIRTVLESDYNLEMAIAKVQNIFQENGFEPKDFKAQLRKAETAGIFTLENQNSWQTELVRFAAPDIYVEFQFNFQEDGPNYRCHIILTAYETATANSISSLPAPGKLSASKDVSMHVLAALKDNIQEWFELLRANFAKAATFGRSVALHFTFDQSSTLNAFSPIGASKVELSTLLEEWVRSQAVKGDYDIGMLEEKIIPFERIQIPLLKRPECVKYTNPNFASDVAKYLTSIGVPYKRGPVGSIIYFTIL